MKKNLIKEIILAIISFILVGGGLALDFVVAFNLKKDPDAVGHWVPAFVVLGLILAIIMWTVVSLITLFSELKKKKNN